jgi:hypothetical protein
MHILWEKDFDQGRAGFLVGLSTKAHGIANDDLVHRHVMRAKGRA